MNNKKFVCPGDMYGKWEIIEEVEPRINTNGKRTRRFLCRNTENPICVVPKDLNTLQTIQSNIERGIKPTSKEPKGERNGFNEGKLKDFLDRGIGNCCESCAVMKCLIDEHENSIYCPICKDVVTRWSWACDEKEGARNKNDIHNYIYLNLGSGLVP